MSQHEALLPCLCLDLTVASMAKIDESFGRCPLCQGSGACTRALAEEFADAWDFSHPVEVG